MTIEEQLRGYGRSIEQRRIPITAHEAMNDEAVMFDPADNGEPRSPRRRWMLSAAVAVLVAATVGLLAFGGGDSEPSDTPIDSPQINSTVPSTTVPVTAPVTTTPTETAPSTTMPTATTTPTTAPTPTTSPAPSPAVLAEPVSGQTQQTVVGDITWTRLEGDASTLPTTIWAQIDGNFFATDERGRTWRSADGISWELDPDPPEFGEDVFEFNGETWTKLFTSGGPERLGRWDGEMFVPVDLPQPTVPDVAGLQALAGSSPPPVELGDQLVVPVRTNLSIPWNELLSAETYPMWDPETETIQLFDWNSDVLLAEFEVVPVESNPGRLAVRDVDTGETLTTVETIPGVDPDDFLMGLARPDSFSHHDFLVSDGDGFERFEAPWDFAHSVSVTALDGRLLSVVSYANPVSGSTRWELWESRDARTWTSLEFPTGIGSLIDHVGISSDGSRAFLTIRSYTGGWSEKIWSSVDGVTWTPVDADENFGSPRYSDIGWLRSSNPESDPLPEQQRISVSADGLVWQEIPFDIRTPEAGGGGYQRSVLGQTIFITEYSGDERTMWVGQVDDS